MLNFLIEGQFAPQRLGQQTSLYMFPRCSSFSVGCSTWFTRSVFTVSTSSSTWTKRRCRHVDTMEWACLRNVGVVVVANHQGLATRRIVPLWPLRTWRQYVTLPRCSPFCHRSFCPSIRSMVSLRRTSGRSTKASASLSNFGTAHRAVSHLVFSGSTARGCGRQSPASMRAHGSY